jgi:serine/threonine protein kinase
MGKSVVLQASCPDVFVDNKGVQSCDLDLPFNTPLFDAITREAACPVLSAMTPMHVARGERFISQGDQGDNLYIIQDGTCAVSVEKNQENYLVARLNGGDIVGEIALLTGGPRTANVDAETDMTLWCLTKSQFDSFCTEYPDLKDYIVELATTRLSTEKLTAERSIGKYMVNEIIDRGGWSIVYKGVHTSLNMPVAIKMLKHTMAMDPHFASKFRNEARTIARLNHENIVRVYDIEELYGTVFIIMEYLEGVSLENLLHRTARLPLSVVLDILLQVCSGLNYAHEQGFVHRDIKPGNIFIQPQGRAKILDFGLACCPGTIDFCLPGTVYYMSPEQIEGESVDERTDIYSLGIVAYEMITGQRPYLEDDLAKLMDLHVQEDIPDPRVLVPDLPEPLHYFIKRATQRNPAARFKTVWEILRDLQPLANDLSLEKQLHAGEQQKTLRLSLSYQDGHQLILNDMVEDLSNELIKIGAVLRKTDIYHLQSRNSFCDEHEPPDCRISF